MIIQGCRTWSLAPLAIPWDPRQFLQLVRSASSPTMGGFTARATPPPSCDPLAQATGTPLPPLPPTTPSG